MEQANIMNDANCVFNNCAFKLNLIMREHKKNFKESDHAF